MAGSKYVLRAGTGRGKGAYVQWSAYVMGGDYECVLSTNSRMAEHYVHGAALSVRDDFLDFVPLRLVRIKRKDKR